MIDRAGAIAVPRRLRWTARPWLVAVPPIAALALPVLDPAVQLFYRDTGQCFYPFKRFIAGQLARGESPFWAPWTEAGTSVLAQVTPGLLHPLTLLYLVLPFELAFKLNHLVALPLAFVGLYLLCRRAGASAWSAAGAGCAYAGCGCVVSMVSSNLPWALAAGAIPLAIHAALRFAESPRPGRLLWAGYALALCLYGGEAHSAVLAALVGTSWIAGRDRTWRAVGLCALWGLCAALLAAPAALPVVSRAAHSARLEGISDAERQMFRTAPARLLGLAVPRAFDAYVSNDAVSREQPFTEYFARGIDDAYADSIVLGVPVLLLAFAGFRRNRMLLAGALLFVVFATRAGLPGLAIFRYPEKLLLPASMLLCLCAALGLDGLADRPVRLARWSGGAALLLALAWSIASLDGFTAWLRARGTTGEAAPAAVFAGALRPALLTELGLAVALAGIALLRARRPSLPAGPAVAAVCALAAVSQTAGLIAVMPIELLHAPVPLAEEMLHRAGPSEGRWRMRGKSSGGLVLKALDARARTAIASMQALNPDYHALFGIESVSEYTSLGDADYRRAQQRAPFAMAQLFGVRFDVRGIGDLAPDEARRLGYERGPFGAWVKELPPRPLAFLARCARAAPGRARALELLGAADFRVDEPVVPRDLGMPCPGEPPGDAVLQREAADRLRVAVASPRPALLVVAEHADPGWHARVDGVEVTAVRADLAAIGVPVPAGRHLVTLRFVPQFLVLGLVLAGACALILGGLAVREAARPRDLMLP